jgi:hypothetical protein
MVVERNVLEWRLDPHGSHRRPEVTGFHRPAVVVCSEAYASSLAADSLRALGYQRRRRPDRRLWAWRAWREAGRSTGPGHQPRDVGGDHRLDPVPRTPSFVEDPGHVGFTVSSDAGLLGDLGSTSGRP